MDLFCDKCLAEIDHPIIYQIYGTKDYKAEELTERFVRGDSSRNSEGSGLGLAIAKSFTELQSGQFEISIDGDLFKVGIRFAK